MPVRIVDGIRMTGLLTKHRVIGLLASVDAVLVYLQKCDLFRSVLPAKIFEALRNGRAAAQERVRESGVREQTRRRETRRCRTWNVESDESENTTSSTHTALSAMKHSVRTEIVATSLRRTRFPLPCP